MSSSRTGVASRNLATRESPFFMLYGRDPVLPTEEAVSQPVDRCYLGCDDYRSQMVQNLSETWSRAQKNIEKAQKQQRNSMTGGSACLLFRLVIEFSYICQLPNLVKAYKLSRPFHGPYRIVTLHDNGANVRPVDRLQDVTIRVPFARLCVCLDEIPDKSYPLKKSGLDPAAAKPADTKKSDAVVPDNDVPSVWKGRLYTS